MTDFSEMIFERKQPIINGNKRTYHKGMFTSLKQDWQTPKEIYEGLHKEFNFDFDPCPINPTFDGLEIDWGKRNFVNPPYGRYKEGKYKGKSAQDLFVKKAYEELQKGNLCVLLIPVRTSSARWQKYILDNPKAQIRCMPQRFKFSEFSTAAMFCSAIIVFDPNMSNEKEETLKRVEEGKLCALCGSIKLDKKDCPCGKKVWCVFLDDIQKLSEMRSEIGKC